MVHCEILLYFRSEATELRNPSVDMAKKLCGYLLLAMPRCVQPKNKSSVYSREDSKGILGILVSKSATA